MTGSERQAVLLSLVEQLKDKGSWCGETHIQKVTYLAQELLSIPFGFKFNLYKHGPYSFDLTDELTALRADDLLSLRPQPHPYGPSFTATKTATKLLNKHRDAIAKYEREVQFLTSALGTKGVAELEKLSTGYLVTQAEDAVGSAQARADRLHQLKPHVPLLEAISAIEAIDQLIERSRALQ